MQVSHGAQNGSLFHWENVMLLNGTLLQSNHQCVNIVFTVGMSVIDFQDFTIQTAVLDTHSSKTLVSYELLQLNFKFCFLVVGDMTQDHVAQPSHGTSDSYHAAAAHWKTARCLRWSNEPCEQETATHAIGIAFENRKRTCSLLMGVFLWHDQRQVLYLALIVRKRYQFWYGTWDLQTSKESITILRIWVVLRDISSLIGCFEI